MTPKAYKALQAACIKASANGQFVTFADAIRIGILKSFGVDIVALDLEAKAQAPSKAKQRMLDALAK